jgi:hypothetical protein
MLLPLTGYVQELATKNEQFCSRAHSSSTDPSPSANIVRAGSKAHTHAQGEEKNQAEAGSATGAGFLATSLATIGVSCAPMLRQ